MICMSVHSVDRWDSPVNINIVWYGELYENETVELLMTGFEQAPLDVEVVLCDL